MKRITAVLAAAGLMLAGAASLSGSASAAALPSCAASFRCTDVNPAVGGVAGYYGADDNHTHYRFVESTFVATPHLVNLNGTNDGGVGVGLCNPNTGYSGQIGLAWNGTRFIVAYAKGNLTTSVNDPCVDSGFVTNPITSAPELVGPTAPTSVAIATGDLVYVGIWYAPSGHHFHQLSFGTCDETQGWCRQAYTSTTTQEFWEFGTGAVDNGPDSLTAPANNPLTQVTGANVTCYACPGPVPISDVSAVPVNGVAVGGLYEDKWINGSAQVQMSPNDSLAGAAYNLFNGAT